MPKPNVGVLKECEVRKEGAHADGPRRKRRPNLFLTLHQSGKMTYDGESGLCVGKKNLGTVWRVFSKPLKKKADTRR